ncbi:hypothetical protein [Ancylobacter dichloromethanicus]|uniref:Flagellar basal body-associated protein FliL n=1 Tax=Ancylobacter dichloromethanicus TaxID=518825 RepID=A0A9W6MXI9_9HYPH|nr:hypothetical protein [Ancylobacter dichloromethanicus]GLK70091.1 hypothetical protein GCM10017643_02060 [Ancylobacter dichloromethanicus]
MTRVLFIGLWVCLITLLASYGGVYWMTGTSPGSDEKPYLAGLEYRRLEPITVPMIIDGTVRGYVVAKLVFTADAEALHQLAIEPQIFVTHRAFDEIYTNGRVEFGKLSKYNLAEMMDNIKNKSNEGLNGPLVQEVLVDSINYVDKAEIRSLASTSAGRTKPATAKAEPSTH